MLKNSGPLGGGGIGAGFFGACGMALTEVSKRKMKSTPIVNQACEQIVLEMMKLQTLISEFADAYFKNEFLK